MSTIGAHSSTSMAVKAVVQDVKQVLAKRFTFLEGLPEFFYDFDNGVSEQFKQYYAKIPASNRADKWIALSYTYQSTERSRVQPRNGFSYARPVSSTLKRKINVQYVELPLLFSILSNDSKYLNSLVNYIGLNLNWSRTVLYDDLLWPTWVPNMMYPLGWYIRPSVPNGRLYMCSISGVSGDTEPDWLTDVSLETKDNEASWSCLMANQLKVKAGYFVKNDTIISNPLNNGIMYQYDFGYTLHYADYDDAGELVGVITDVDLLLFDMYQNQLGNIEVNSSKD